MDKFYAVVDFVKANKVKVALVAVGVFILLGMSFGYVPEWPQ